MSYSKLFLYNGDSTIKLTDNLLTLYDISGDKVVWGEYPPQVVMLWDGTGKVQLADSSSEPRISGNNAIWVDRRLLLYTHIYFWDGITSTQISDSAYSKNNDFPKISGDNVVWIGDNSTLYFWNNNIITPVTDNGMHLTYSISGNNVAYTSPDSSVGYKMFLWDGNATTHLDDVLYSNCPLVSGNNIVWSKGYENEREIYFWDGASVTQLTNNMYLDFQWDINGKTVVWEGYDGNDMEIFYWDGSSIKQLTDNDTEDSCPSLQKD